MDRAEQLRQILSARGLSLYRVSQVSAQTFGRSSRFYIPHNLYYDVAESSLIPTIHQMLALSHITNYRLSDWLTVFGLSPEIISRLQLLIPRQQTTLLDSSVYDTHAWIPWFADRLAGFPVLPIAPLRQLLTTAPPKRAEDLLEQGRRSFLYARVGREDYAFPYLAPGSIVRVDPQGAEYLPINGRNIRERHLYLVELHCGWTCSQIKVVTKDRIVLGSPHYPCMHTELTLDKEARILGMIDAEIRPLIHHGDTPVFGLSHALAKRSPLRTHNPHPNLTSLLRSSRLRVGLSFRDASFLSRWIANTLSDNLYFSAASTLSDYETLATPPRHIQKIIALCVLYCIDFRQFLQSSGLPIDQEGQHPIPDEFVPRQVPSERHNLHGGDDEESSQGRAGFLRSLLKQWEEIPLFLRHSLNEITALKNFSLSDVFWVGGDRAPTHPLLVDATLVAVNRRVKKPTPFACNDVCNPPLYLILKRDGTYLCGRCTLRDGKLTAHGYPGGPVGDQQFRNWIDAEVIGQVTAIVRRVTGSSAASSIYLPI